MLWLKLIHYSNRGPRKIQVESTGTKPQQITTKHYTCPYLAGCDVPNLFYKTHQFQNLNDSRLVLQLCVPNPLKPGVKSRMKM